MDGDPPGPLRPDARTALNGCLAIASWALLGTLLWLCFLRTPPRSLALTAAWFATPNPLLATLVTLLVGAGALRLAMRGPGRVLGAVCLAAGLLTILSWGSPGASP